MRNLSGRRLTDRGRELIRAHLESFSSGSAGRGRGMGGNRCGWCWIKGRAGKHVRTCARIWPRANFKKPPGPNISHLALHNCFGRVREGSAIGGRRWGPR